MAASRLPSAEHDMGIDLRSVQYRSLSAQAFTIKVPQIRCYCSSNLFPDNLLSQSFYSWRLFLYASNHPRR